MANDDIDRETEENYLTSESATRLWSIIYGWTNFNRWLVDPADRSMDCNQRLLYLLAVAVLRRVEYLVTDGDWLNLLKVTEAYAEGKATPDQFYEACEVGQSLPTAMLPAATAAAMGAVCFLSDDAKVIEGIEFVYDVAGYLTAIESGELVADANLEFAESVWGSPSFLAGKSKEERTVCALIRDIFGNPFHPVTINPAWLSWHSGLLVSMAQGMYDTRDFSDMPVLADALEEAGCHAPDILAHCREPGEHVRGCWVVDLILGKE